MNRLEEEFMYYNNAILCIEAYLEQKKRICYDDWRYLHDFLDGLKKGRSEVLQQLKRECE